MKIDINSIMNNADKAFHEYKRLSSKKRASFLEIVAEEIEKQREELVSIGNKETNLPLARLNGELTRTTSQLKMFAALIEEGSWVEACIDTPEHAHRQGQTFVK